MISIFRRHGLVLFFCGLLTAQTLVRSETWFIPSGERQSSILMVEKRMPETLPMGGTFTYRIKVTNIAKTTVRNVTVFETEDVNLTVLQTQPASDGMTPDGRVFRLGDLQPRQWKEVQIRTRIGQVEDSVGTCTTVRYSPMKLCAESRIQGIPAILLEVVDQEDPIMVGDFEIYHIIVTNQGSRADTNIRIIVELEDSQEFVGFSGPTEGVREGNRLEFGVDKIDPKQHVSWKVKVKAVRANDVRFKVQLTSSELKRPVQETEATNQYLP